MKNYLLPIAHIESPFHEKFGIPRQSGLVPEIRAKIIFEPEYAIPEALRGLEGYSHIWLIWGFHKAERDTWSPTVRPPRLGGNKRVGVFATRSPFRPNSLGLSVVRLEKTEGCTLYVKGADLLDGTPIYDIKPYLPHIDSIPDALSGFAGDASLHRLEVVIPEDILNIIPENNRENVKEILAQDPRPAYQHDPQREYGFSFDNMEIKFKVEENILTVTNIIA